MIKLLNAFSLNMLAEFPAQPQFEEIDLDEAREILRQGFDSAVGHAETAAVFSDQLSVTVPVNRVTVSLRADDMAIIGQYRGPRLPEGATSLPIGATIKWYRVFI